MFPVVCCPLLSAHYVSLDIISVTLFAYMVCEWGDKRMNKVWAGRPLECVDEPPPLISCHPELWYSALPSKLDTHLFSLIKYPHRNRQRLPVSTLGRWPASSTIFREMSHLLNSKTSIVADFQLTFTLVYIWRGKENKMYFYGAAWKICLKENWQFMSLTDSLKMNVEGGGEELHSYKM